jgi:protein-disulfide isomerase
MPADKKADKTGEHALGSARAPVTLVEYGDFECPYCGGAHRRMDQIRRLFGEKLRFVFKNFPLTEMHPNAMNAARAAEAAGRQKSFWPMYDILYENQDELDETALFEYADEIGLDIEKFARDYRSKRIENDVESDMREGEEAGVDGTPAFFINGTRFKGSWEDQDLVEAIREALGENEPGQGPSGGNQKRRRRVKDMTTGP